MATILSGDIGLQANIAAEFGHHVATLDATRSHVSDARPVSSMDMSVNDFVTHIAPVSHRHPKYLDYRQYNIFSNQYVDSDYLFNMEDVVAPTNQFNEPMTVGQSTTLALSGNPDSNHRFYFDFADYIGLTGTATVTGTVTHKAGGAVNFKFYEIGGGISTADTFSISSGTQDFSVTFSIGSTGLDHGFLHVNMEAAGVVVDSVRGSAEVSDLRCSIAVTGRTRLNTANVYVNTFTELNDLVGTGGTAVRDSALRFENWDRGSVIAGNPVPHGIVASFGVLDMLYPDFSSSTEDIEGRMKVQYDKPSQDSAIPATTSLVIRKDNADVLSAPIPDLPRFSFGLGGAATTLTQTQPEPALTDLPAISHFVALNDGSLSLADTTDIDIELRYIDPASDGTDVRTGDDGYQPGFVQARLLLNLPFVSEDINLASSFTSTQTGQRLVKDPNVIDMDPTFTANFRGGIRQEGVANLTANFSVPLTQSGIGMILFTDPRRQTFEFFPGPGQIGPTGRIENRLHDDIRDASGSPIAPGLTIVRSPAIDPDLLFEATVTTSVKMIRGEAINLQVSLGQELEPSATGVIISNAETETFEFSLAVTAVLAIETDRFRELLLPAQTRKYNIMQETRDYAINTDTRKYPVPAETRQEAVDTESRILKQKGYNS
jgi:hypothetical protein